MDKIDFKLKFKELYAPKQEPCIIEVPAMNFIMVDGHGNPNETDGEYQKAVELLYAFSYTIKMSRKKANTSNDIFSDYVVPPLEGLWWLSDKDDMDFTKKNQYCWTSMIRQPDFITRTDYDNAILEINKKKPELDTSKARFEIFEEGLCVQCMHLGPFDNEPVTLVKMDEFLKNNQLMVNIGAQTVEGRTHRHHEIYLSDPRKVIPSARKTILRHPIKKVE